jgi:hypothetical protein
LLSRGQVNFQSSWSDFPQIYDAWRNIGLYYLPQTPPGDLHFWSMRDEYTIVAVDRVAIVPARQQRPLLGPIRRIACATWWTTRPPSSTRCAT